MSARVAMTQETTCASVPDAAWMAPGLGCELDTNALEAKDTLGIS